MEKPTLLLSMQWIVGRIEIQDQHLAVARQTPHAQLQKHILHGLRIGMHLAVTVRKVGPQLQAVQSRRARAGEARILGAAPLGSEHILLAHGHSQKRIAPQIGMVVEILVTQSQGKKTLAHQLVNGMFDEFGIARIGEATRDKAADSQSGINLAQEKKPAIGTERTAREIGNDFSGTQVLKKQGLGETVCLTGGGVS